MKRFFGVMLVPAVTALLLFGCDFLRGPDAPAGGGNLVIGFGEARGISLAAVPTPEEQAQLRYELVLTGPAGQTRNVSLAPGQTFNEQVDLGEWHIYAEAYDPGNALIGTGSADVTVKAGMNQARVLMKVAGPAAGPAAEYAWVVSTIAGSFYGHADGPGASAKFASPAGITIDAAGNLYVADRTNHRVRKIANDGFWTVTTIAGGGAGGFADGTGISAFFNQPMGITIDAAGSLYVADSVNHRIRKIVESPPGTFTVSTIAGSTQGFAEGVGTAAQFYTPAGITIDAAGNLYVADLSNHRIRMIANDGLWTVSTIAGSTQGFAEGVGTTAQFYSPAGITIDAAGNLYVAERANRRIRKIANDGLWTVSTIAGDGTAGWLDGAGAVAQFDGLTGITMDGAGNFYVAAWINQRIRKIADDGWVTTIAGSVQGFADGPGASALFYNPTWITIDAAENLYVADEGNNRIRKLTWQQVN